jgi:hypothetical protein
MLRVYILLCSTTFGVYTIIVPAKHTICLVQMTRISVDTHNESIMYITKYNC